MVLEATMVCLDNSDWMRNGDYTPTRLEAQHDAVNLLCGAKTQSNPESTVGAIACAGKTPEVLVTLTADLGKILSSVHNLKIGGTMNFSAGIQVAQLALKHRQNKNQHQRIVVFVGSPLKDDKEELVRLAKRMKKNNIAVDVINFGEEGENTEKLEAFVNAVNSNDNSHLVTVPPGPHILSDILISSPIISEDGGAGAFVAGGGGGGSANAEFGFDPNMDPELALAIKLSMEEDRARQEAETRRAQEESGASTTAPTTEVQMTDSTSAATSSTPAAVVEDEDALLQQALALSMAAAATPAVTTTPTPTPTTSTTPPSTTTANKDVDMHDVDEDEEMRLALQMSLSQPAPSATTSTDTSASSDDINRVMEDPNFVNSVLMSLPGVDPNDERIKSVLQSFQQKKDDDKHKK